MNIYNTINDYIKRNIEYDELNNRLECVKRNCAYVEAKGDIEFHKGRFDKEKDYNEFHKIYKTECERIECELTELDKHRAEIHNQYMEELENLSNDDIREVIDDLLLKKKNKETEIYYLSLERTDDVITQPSNGSVSPFIGFNVIGISCFQLEAIILCRAPPFDSESISDPLSQTP